MKKVKIQFADTTDKINVTVSEDIDEVLSNLEFDPYIDNRFNNIESFDDLLGEFLDESKPDIITGMRSIDFNDLEEDLSWVFSIGKVSDIEKHELDENGYKYKYFITENNIVYAYYSLCE